LSGGTINNDMTDEQILQWLKDNGLLTQQGDLNSAKLSEISGITFIHEDSGKRFNMKINSEGVLESTEIDSL